LVSRRPFDSYSKLASQGSQYEDEKHYRSMSSQTPPAPPGWKKTIEDLFDESRAGNRSSVGSPEVDWARDYERSLIPAGTRFTKSGDIYQAIIDVEVSYLTSWSAPCMNDHGV